MSFRASTSQAFSNGQTIFFDSNSSLNRSSRIKNPSQFNTSSSLDGSAINHAFSSSRRAPIAVSVKSRRIDDVSTHLPGHHSFPHTSAPLKVSPCKELDIFNDVDPFGTSVPTTSSSGKMVTSHDVSKETPIDVVESPLHPDSHSERSKREQILFERATGREHRRKLTFRATLFLAKLSSSLNVHEPSPGPSAILPWLYIGDAQDAQNLFLLRDKLRITHVLNAAGTCPRIHEDKFIYLHLPLLDVELQDLTEAFSLSATFITDAKLSGGRVFVHCAAGISRSVAVVLAYLIQRGSAFIRDGEDLTLDEAFALVQYKRPQALPNAGFRKQLALYEVQVRGKSSILRRIGRSPWKGEQFNAIIDQLSNPRDVHRRFKEKEQRERKDQLHKQFLEPVYSTDVENPPIMHQSRSKPSSRTSIGVTPFVPTAFSTVPPIFARPPENLDVPNNPSSTQIQVRATRAGIPMSPARTNTSSSNPYKQYGSGADSGAGGGADTLRTYSSTGSQRNPITYSASPVSFFQVTPSPGSGRHSFSSSSTPRNAHTPRQGGAGRKGSMFTISPRTASTVSPTSSYSSHGFSWSQSDPTTISSTSFGLRF